MATSKFYQHYIRSPEWRELAERRLEIDGHRCVVCGCSGTPANPLECHHLSYRRLGQEDVFLDVCSLCRCCHKAVHKLMSRTTGYDKTGNPQRGWSDTLRSYISVSDIGGALHYTELTERDDQE